MNWGNFTINLISLGAIMVLGFIFLVISAISLSGPGTSTIAYIMIGLINVGVLYMMGRSAHGAYIALYE